MESTVALALMVKARMVFAADDTFLSFPLGTQYVYTPEQLSFMLGVMSGNMTNECIKAMREYSRIVDAVPSGEHWQPTDEGSLSDVYWDVLTTAKLASSTRTVQEETDYQKAVTFLYTVGPDGSRTDTPPLLIYRQYRDAYYALQANYSNKKIDATYSTDPVVKAQWTNIEEPALRRKMQEVEDDWLSRGFRAQVEQAKQVVETLGAKSPASIWAEWKKQCDPEIDKVTDPTTNESFYPSGFSPSNVLNSSGWFKFTLSSDEVNALFQHAPPELAGRLALGQADLDIESLSFEFCSVGVVRAWFVSKALKARFWRFADPTKKVCDGACDRCGYVAALVFARDVQVQLKQHSARNNDVLQRLARAEPLSIATFRVTLPTAGEAAQRSGLVLRTGVLTQGALSRPAAVSPVAARPTIGRQIVANPERRFDSPRRAENGRGIAVAAGAGAIARLRNRSFPRISTPSAPPGPTLSPPYPSVPQQATNEIYIMAFICKSIGACPNPDPVLQW